MPLSRLVVRLYALLLEIALWLMLLSGVVVGWALHGLTGALLGALLSAIFGAVFLGAFLVLNDIRARLEALEKHSR